MPVYSRPSQNPARRISCDNQSIAMRPFSICSPIRLISCFTLVEVTKIPARAAEMIVPIAIATISSTMDMPRCLNMRHLPFQRAG